MIQPTLRSRIVHALSALIGLPLWGATRAPDTEMFQFGERQGRLSRTGTQVDVGEYALHIQCPWHIVGPNRIVVGSEDRNYPEDESANWKDLDSDGPSRCEAKIGSWLNEHAAAPPRVERVEADDLVGSRFFWSVVSCLRRVLPIRCKASTLSDGACCHQQKASHTLWSPATG